MGKGEMEYEWVQSVDCSIDSEDDLGDGFFVVGFAVCNSNTGEGAMVIPRTEILDGIERADVWKDILIDTECAYEDSIPGIFPKKVRPI